MARLVSTPVVTSPARWRYRRVPRNYFCHNASIVSMPSDSGRYNSIRIRIFHAASSVCLSAAHSATTSSGCSRVRRCSKKFFRQCSRTRARASEPSDQYNFSSSAVVSFASAERLPHRSLSSVPRSGNPPVVFSRVIFAEITLPFGNGNFRSLCRFGTSCLAGDQGLAHFLHQLRMRGKGPLPAVGFLRPRATLCNIWSISSTPKCVCAMVEST